MRDLSNSDTDLPYSDDVDPAMMFTTLNGELYISNRLMMDPEHTNVSNQFFMYSKQAMDPIILRGDNYKDYLLDHGIFSENVTDEYVLRSLPIGEDNEMRVFTSEVVTVLSAIIQKPEHLAKQKSEKLKMLKEQWEAEEYEELFTTISVSRFEEILREFKVYNRPITIIPDLVYQFTSTEALRKPLAPVGTLNGNGEMVMTGDEAIFYTFQSVVCGQQWDEDEIYGNEKYDEFRQCFFDTMDHYMKIEKGLLIAKSYVDEGIECMKLFIEVDNLAIPVPDYLCEKQKIRSHVNQRLYVDTCKCLRIDLDERIHSGLPVWKARVLFIYGTLLEFIEPDRLNERMKVVMGLCNKVPEEFREDMREEMEEKVMFAMIDMGVGGGDCGYKEEEEESDDVSDEEEYESDETDESDESDGSESIDEESEVSEESDETSDDDFLLTKDVPTTSQKMQNLKLNPISSNAPNPVPKSVQKGPKITYIPIVIEAEPAKCNYKFKYVDTKFGASSLSNPSIVNVSGKAENKKPCENCVKTTAKLEEMTRKFDLMEREMKKMRMEMERLEKEVKKRNE